MTPEPVRIGWHVLSQAFCRRWHLALGVVSILLVGLLSMAVSRHQNLAYDGMPYLYATLVKATYNPPAAHLEMPPLLFYYLRLFIDHEELEVPYQAHDFELVNGTFARSIFDADRLVELQLRNREVFPGQVSKAKHGMILCSSLGCLFLLAILHRLSNDRILVLLLLILFVTQPLIVAHMNLVMSDMLIMTVYLIAVWLLVTLLQSTAKDKAHWYVLLALTIVSGALLLIKFTCLGLFLGIVLAVTLRRYSWRRRLLCLGLIVVIPVLLINLAYSFSWNELPHTGVAARATSVLAPRPYSELLGTLIAYAPLPDAYLAGLTEFLRHLGEGHKAYLVGESYTDGRWYFFPVSLLLKLTIFSTVAIATSLIYLLARLMTRGLRTIGPVELAVLAPPFLLFLLALVSRVNDGVRHVLWVVPFLFVTVAIALRGSPRHMRQIVLCLLGAGIVYNLMALGIYYPAYIPFIDPVFGGPIKASLYLGGSSIDVGEHLWAAEDYLLQQRGVDRVISYFGGTTLPRHLDQLEWVPDPEQFWYDRKTRVLLSESLRTYDRRSYEAIIEGFELEKMIHHNILILRPTTNDPVGGGVRVFRIGSNRPAEDVKNARDPGGG